MYRVKRSNFPVFFCHGHAEKSPQAKRCVSKDEAAMTSVKNKVYRNFPQLTLLSTRDEWARLQAKRCDLNEKLSKHT